jgi:hypothetical protein
MATAINIDALSLVAEQANDISQVIFEKKIEKGSIAAFHAVITGIQHGKKIPFVGNIAIVGECIEGCAIPDSASIPMSEQTWAPKTLGFRLEHCSKDLNSLAFYLKKKISNAVDQYDMTNSPEETIIQMKAEDATEEMLWRILHFGDTAMLKVAGGGVLVDTAGIKLKYFTCLDGLWKQVFTKYGPAISGGANYVAIPANATASYALQDTLAADYTKGLIKAMIKKADSRLKTSASKILLLTESLAENLMDSYEETAWKNAVNIKKDLADLTSAYGQGNYIGTYRGIDIFSMPYWDNSIRAWFDNGTKWDKPHRALLTTADNIPVGTPSTEMLGSLDSFYDRKDKKNYVDGEVMVDIKILETYMAVAAY